MDDLDLRRQRYMTPAAPAPVPASGDEVTRGMQDATAAGSADDLDARRAKYQSSSGSAPDQTTYQATGESSGDPIAPAMRAMIAEEPGATYGHVLPLKRTQSGQLQLAFPGAVHDLANGVLDLMEGPATGRVTPLGTNALMTGAFMRPGGYSLKFAGQAPTPGTGMGKIILGPNGNIPQVHILGLNKYGQQIRQDFSPDGKIPTNYPVVPNNTGGYQYWTGDVLTPEEYYHPNFEPDDYADPPQPTKPFPNKYVAPPPPPMPLSSPGAEKTFKLGGGAAGATLGGMLGGATEAMVGATLGPLVGDLARHVASKYGPQALQFLRENSPDVNLQNLLLLSQPWQTAPLVPALGGTRPPPLQPQPMNPLIRNPAPLA